MEIKDLKNEALSKKVIIFDVDKTLTESKSPLDEEMARLLVELLKHYKVSVITGGKFGQMKDQILSFLDQAKDNFSNLYFQPTSGGSLYEFKDDSWEEVYKNEIPEEERKKIISLLNEAIVEAGIQIPEKMYGERIEDRLSQITFSNFGQQAPSEIKESWDSDNQKRGRVIDILKPKLPEYEVTIGGSTSIDIMQKGISKRYGVEKLSEHLNIKIDEMLFIGDRLEPGGNDASVIESGIDWTDVENPDETKEIIRGLIEIKS